MDTGNKAIVLICGSFDSKMFPFDYEEGPSGIPLGSRSLLEYWITLVDKYPHDKIYLAAKEAPNNFEICSQHNLVFINIEGLFAYLSTLSSDVILINTKVYINDIDYQQLIYSDENAVLVTDWTMQEKSFGVSECDVYIQEIYAHPRDHYVKFKILPLCLIRKQWVKQLIYIRKGSYTINCGQMPDAKYHVESVVDQLIYKGMKCIPIKCKKRAVYVKYPWNIMEINEDYCLNLTINSDEIDHSAIISNVQRSPNSQIHVGRNSILENITIEGNCWIGDNVIIRNGAYLGSNCIINDQTVINNNCLVHANTCIGPKNKIGFGAEVYGVTMEGVAMVHTCEVYGIFGKYVDIAAGVFMSILRFDDRFVQKRVNETNLASPYTNMICIGDHVRTGVNNVFFPGVFVGENSALGPGLLIDQDVAKNSLVLVKQETISKNWGPNRYGW